MPPAERAPGYGKGGRVTACPQFKEVQRVVLRVVPTLVEGAEGWLEKIRGNLLAASSVWRAEQLIPRPQGP